MTDKKHRGRRAPVSEAAPVTTSKLQVQGSREVGSQWPCKLLAEKSLGAGNETRTRDLNLGKIVPHIFLFCFHW